MRTKEDIFKYFDGKMSAKEADALNAWMSESAENRSLYREAAIEYELLLMQGDRQEEDFATDRHIQRKSGLKNFRRVFLRTVYSVAAAVALFLVATWISEYRLDHNIAGHPVEVTVPAGQRLSITLADGTFVDLNAGARLTYPAAFRGKEREVSLEGEAMFHVTHNDKSPFIVHTFAADVRVLGTKFNVNADANEGEFATTLIEGKVQVTSNDDTQSLILLPDQRVSIKGGRLYTEDIKASDAVLWTEGIIDISGMDFERLIKRLEQAYGVRIVVEREEMPVIGCVSGKIRISEGIDHVMKILSYLSDFKYEKDILSGTIYIR